MDIKEGSGVTFKFVTATKPVETAIKSGTVIKMREHTATLVVHAGFAMDQPRFSLPDVAGGRPLAFISVAHDRLTALGEKYDMTKETLLRLQNELQNYRMS